MKDKKNKKPNYIKKMFNGGVDKASELLKSKKSTKKVKVEVMSSDENKPKTI